VFRHRQPMVNARATAETEVLDGRLGPSSPSDGPPAPAHFRAHDDRRHPGAPAPEVAHPSPPLAGRKCPIVVTGLLPYSMVGRPLEGFLAAHFPPAPGI